MFVRGFAEPCERCALRRMAERLDKRCQEGTLEVVAGQHLDGFGDKRWRQRAEPDPEHVNAGANMDQRNLGPFTRSDTD